MKVVLGAGAFVAVEGRDGRIGAPLRVLQQRRIPLWTSAAVVAQVWRDGARQAPLASLLAGVGIRGLGAEDGKRCGELQRAAGTKDVVDAHVALMADAGDRVVTSDAGDIQRLLDARQVRASVIRA